MKPLQDQIHVELLKEDQSAGGVLLPDAVKEGGGMLRRGKVLGIGPGARHMTDDGFFHYEPIDVKVGDIIWFDQYSAAKIDSRQDEYMVPAKRLLATD